MKNALALSLMIFVLPLPSLFAQTSESIRSEKTFMIESHAGFNGAGGGFGIFLPADSRLDISVSQSDILQFVESSKIYKVEIQSFVRNSFYYSLGLNHRILKNSTYYYGSSYIYDEYTVSEIETSHAHFVIGNEWSFRYFFIGAEWFGLSAPLTWKYTAYYPEGSSETDKRHWDSNARRDALQTVVTLPNLYIGFAF